jgi:xylulokinase
MEQVTVGLDIGTTSIKAVAVDAAGKIHRRARIPHRVVTPLPDRLEHDADRAWRRGPRRALEALGSLQPVAAAVTSMVPSLAAVNRKGRPITPGLLYGDARGRSGPALPEAGAGAAGAEVAGFLSWAAKEAPDAYGFWPAQAVANYELGRTPTVDMIVGFISSPLYGLEGWDAELCKACGVRPEQLPLVEAPGAAAGRVDDDPDGPILAAGTADAFCEQLVAGASEPGDVHVILGSTLIVWVIDRIENQTKSHSSLWTVPVEDRGIRLIGGASNAGGLFLDWATKLTGRRRSSETVDAADLPVWVPYVRGERTPYHDPRLRAGLHDVNLTHRPAEIEQAAWEAAGFVVRHHIELAGAAGNRIVATGGGTKIEGLVRALAYTTGLPVHVAAEPEGAALGAAFLARHAAGLETNFEDAARWAATREVVEPDAEWSKHSEDRYKRFRELSGPAPSEVHA